jgi:hypothetical protein
MSEPGPNSPTLSPFVQWLSRLSERAVSFEKLVFILLLLLFLVPVWKEKYILNTDGPAHTYTAKVLLDYMTGKNTVFYNQYYQIKLFPDPNWFSRFALMVLQVFFNWRIAEKLLVSLYLVLFPVLFRKLILQINPANGVLSFFIFPFLYHHVFNYGFYNYSFSLVFLFGFLLFWKRKQDQLNIGNCVIGTLLCTLIYFTHLWGFVFTGFFTGLLIVHGALVQFKERSVVEALRDCVIKLSKLAMMMLPGLILSLIFIKKFLMKEELDSNEMPELTHGFFHLDILSIYSLKELPPAFYFAISILVLFAITVVMKIRSRRWVAEDGYLVCAILSTAIFFIEPERLTVGAFWIGRMVMLPYFFILLWSTSVLHFKWVKVVSGLAVACICIWMLLLRWPYYHRVSQSVEEYLSVSQKIPMHSTVLPISFNHKGNMPDGTNVCPEFWKFIHAFDYGCIDREAITFAHNNWIPLLWKNDKDPFVKMGDMEEQPPVSNFVDYPKNSNGGEVEYVVTWCMDKNFVNTWQWANIKKQLDEHYVLIATSPNNLAKLYHLKSVL